jgi:hypothetical protein
MSSGRSRARRSIPRRRAELDEAESCTTQDARRRRRPDAGDSQADEREDPEGGPAAVGRAGSGGDGGERTAEAVGADTTS